jgi:integrase
MPKRGNGEGSVWYDEGSRRWMAEVSLPTGPGGKRQRTRRRFLTRAEAVKARTKMLAERDQGLLTIVRNETVLDYGLHWARNVKALAVRPSTAADYEYRLRQYIAPYLGHIRLSDLTADHIERWLQTMRRSGKSAPTVNGARQVLHGICRHALRNRVIPFNPVESTQPVRRHPDDPTQVRPAWSLVEVTTVLAAAREDDDLDTFLHAMLHLGLRPGEALALRWADVQADRLWVNHTLKQDRRILPDGRGVVRLRLDAPKTAKSQRPLPIPAGLAAAFERQRLRTSIRNVSNPADWVDSDFVIVSRRGTPVHPSNLRRRYLKFLQEIGIRYIRFHDLRHTVATLALGEGNLPIEKASQALGHTRIDTTKQIYASHVPRYNDDFVEAIGCLLPEAAPVQVDRAHETRSG